MRAVAGVLVACLAASWPLAVAAQEGERQAARLAGPEVYKLDWNTRSLTAADVDGDGRRDLVLLNNGRAKIDILYQRKPGRVEKETGRKRTRRTWEPTLEDARFRVESIVTGIKMFALAAGDLDGDGLTDLAFTGNPDGLTLLFQGPKGDWGRRRVFESERPNQWGGTLAIEDLDGDGRPELVALMREEVLVFSRAARGEPESPRRYPLTDEDGYGLVIEDLDGDGRRDLMYLVAKNDYPWRVRLQRAAGGFGPERAFRIQAPRRDLRPLRLAGRELTSFAVVQNQTGLIEFVELAESDGASSPDQLLAPQVYSVPPDEATASSYAVADFDGDNLTDLVVADRKGAQVWLYLQRDDGTFEEPVAFPSLSDVRSLATGDVDGDGRAELFAVSRGEAAVGLSRFSGEGRLSYPQPLEVAGKPLAAAALDLNGDGAVELACAVQNDGARSVAILSSDDAGRNWRQTRSVELQGLRTDPAALKVIDADRDGRSDLAVFIVQSPMRILRQQPDGSFHEISAEKGFRRGLLDNLAPAALGAGDLDGDERAEMIVAGKGFARALRLDADGELGVLDQFNARDGETEIAAAVPLDVDGDRVPEMLLIAKGGERIEMLRRDRKGVYRHAGVSSVGRIDLVDTRLERLGRDRRPTLLVLGADRFWAVPIGGRDLRVRSFHAHEPEMEDMVYVELAFADFQGSADPEMVALDTRQSRYLELLSWNGESWSVVLHFPVFEVDPHYQGRQGAANEPREMVVTDLTSDGRPDIALLVHDRVLIYLGSASGSPTGGG